MQFSQRPLQVEVVPSHGKPVSIHYILEDILKKHDFTTFLTTLIINNFVTVTPINIIFYSLDAY